MNQSPPSSSTEQSGDAQRFRRRLYLLGAVALAGLAALTARLVWLQLF